MQWLPRNHIVDERFAYDSISVGTKIVSLSR